MIWVFSLKTPRSLSFWVIFSYTTASRTVPFSWRMISSDQQLLRFRILPISSHFVVYRNRHLVVIYFGPTLLTPDALARRRKNASQKRHFILRMPSFSKPNPNQSDATYLIHRPIRDHVPYSRPNQVARFSWIFMRVPWSPCRKGALYQQDSALYFQHFFRKVKLNP